MVGGRCHESTPPTPDPLVGGGLRTAPGRTRWPPLQDDVDGQPSHVGDGHVQSPIGQPRGRSQSFPDLPHLPPLSDRQARLLEVLRAALPRLRQPDRLRIHRNLLALLVPGRLRPGGGGLLPCGPGRGSGDAGQGGGKGRARQRDERGTVGVGSRSRTPPALSPSRIRREETAVSVRLVGAASSRSDSSRSSRSPSDDQGPIFPRHLSRVPVSSRVTPHCRRSCDRGCRTSAG
jgi:hypothetical protein